MRKSRIVVFSLSVLFAGLVFQACSNDTRRRPRGNQFAGSGGFFSSNTGSETPSNPSAPGLLAGINGTVHITRLLSVNRQQNLGEGFIGVSVPTEPNNSNEAGFNKVVTVWVVFSGKNIPGNGETPHLAPNYIDGADNGRPESHYEPIPMSLEKTDSGSGAQVWKVTITTFPAGGSMLFGLLRHYVQGDPSKTKYYEGAAQDSSYKKVSDKTDGFKFWITSSNTIVSNAAPGQAQPPGPLAAPNPPAIVTNPSQHFAHLQGGHATKELQNPTNNPVVIGDGYVHVAYLSQVDTNNHRVKFTVSLSNVVAGENNVPSAGQEPHLFPDYEFPSGRPSSHFEAVKLTQIPGTDLWEATVDTFPNNGRFFMNLTVNGNQPNNPGANIFVKGLDKDSAYESSKKVLQFWTIGGEVFGPAAPGVTQPPSPPGPPNQPPSNPPPAASHFNSLDPASISVMTSEVVAGQIRGEGIAVVHTATSVNGNNVTLDITIYLGPGTDSSGQAYDNTPGSGQQPYLFPNYINGAEVGRPAADYVPILLTEVPGSNRTLWRCTVTTFPTNGDFVFTLSKDGNSFDFSQNVPVAALQQDSAYHLATQSLKFFWDQVLMKASSDPAP